MTFWVGAAMQDADGEVTAADRAPDGGSWVYGLSKPVAVPTAPRAGTLLSLSFPVTRTDTGAPLSGGTVVAAATVAGKAIPRTVSFSNSTAQVAIAIPWSAKGKTLQVKVTVTVDGKSATRTVRFHVR